VGKKYSMLERMKYVNIKPSIGKYYDHTKEEIANIRSTGLIEPAIYSNDKGTLINVQKISVGFYGISKNTLRKEVRMLFDISVESRSYRFAKIEKNKT